MKYLIATTCIFITLFSCNSNQNKKEQRDTLGISTEVAIRNTFPGAVPVDDYIDSLLFFLYAVHNIESNKILVGQSTCTDDVINTKDSFAQHAVKGPFNLGGLAGLPFTGTTGYNAFVEHVPDSGTALIFVGSHIGYSQQEGWGMLEREGQAETTTCCGAIMHALDELKHGVRKKSPGVDDYQEEAIEQFALQHKREILSSKAPLITLTKLIYTEAERLILTNPIRESRFKHLVLIVGILINTDHANPDYIWIDHMSIYDLETGQELRIMKK